MEQIDKQHQPDDTSMAGDQKEGYTEPVYSKRRDVAADLVQKFANEPPYDRSEDRKVRFKIDFRLIPFLFLNITLPAMDKITPSTAALYGLREDTGLTGDKYAWVGSAFYVRWYSLCIIQSRTVFMGRTPDLEMCLHNLLVWLSLLVSPVFAIPTTVPDC